MRVRSPNSAAGFTLIELLVVIVIIGLLIGLVTSIGAGALFSQKRTNTLSTMRTVELAIDQFAEINPLRRLYDTRLDPTFGPFPPYQVAGSIKPKNSVASLLDVNRPGSGGQTGQQNGTLADRLFRDCGGTQQGGSLTNWVRIDTSANLNQRIHDDNRALAAYLAMFLPDASATISDSARRPLITGGTGVLANGELINLAGEANNPSKSETNRPILGLHDAWGVPLDYFLMVRVEWGYRPPSQNAGPTFGSSNDPTGFVIRERIPVLRSRGVEREVFEAQLGLPNTPGDVQKWVYSRPLPAPYAQFSNANSGLLDASKKADGGGWLRAVPATGTGQTDKEPFGYRPDQDF